MIRVFTMKAVGKDFLAASWSPYLTEERKKLADRKKGERERQLFLGAEVLLNLSLQQVDARIPIPAKYKRNEHGKPYLEDRQGIYVRLDGTALLHASPGAESAVGIQKLPVADLFHSLLRGANGNLSALRYRNKLIAERQDLSIFFFYKKKIF